MSVTLYDEMDFANRIRLRILELRLLWIIQGAGRQRHKESPQKRKARGAWSTEEKKPMKRSDDSDVGTSQAVLGASEAGNGQEHILSKTSAGEHCPWSHLGLSPVKPISDFRLPELQEHKLVLY